MPNLVLVRHAEPFADGRMSPDRWTLTDDGRNRARRLGRLVAGRHSVRSVWTSSEAKARETAALAFPSVTTTVRDQLGEVARPWYASSEELTDAVGEYLRGEDVEGWEPRAAVVARLDLVKGDLGLHEAPAVVTHGVLLTTWLDHELGLDDPFRFWSELRMPDAWEVDLEQKTVERIG